MRVMRQAVGDPDLDEGLSTYTEMSRLFVQGLNHLCGEVNIDAFYIHVGPFRFGDVGK